MTNATLNVITEFCIVDMFLSENNSQLEHAFNNLMNYNIGQAWKVASMEI